MFVSTKYLFPCVKGNQWVFLLSKDEINKIFALMLFTYFYFPIFLVDIDTWQVSEFVVPHFFG